MRAIAGRICAEHPEVTGIRLFGSIARGDQTGVSDADVIIVLRHGEQGEPMEQARLFYAYFDLPIGVDVLVFTEDQVAARLKDGDAFMKRVWTESRSLH